MSAKSMWLIAVVLVALAAPTPRGRAALAQVEAGNSFLITHVRVFDGDRAHEDTQVAVERGVVRAVGRELTTWRHLPVIDGTGATLLPGLIDAHAHVRSIDDLQEALRFGVTTVLDMGASGVTPGDLSRLRSAAALRMDVADLRFAGFGAPAPDGHGTERRSASAGEAPTVPTVESADAFVAARRGEGSDYLKVFLNGVRTADRGAGNLDESRVKALVDAAHSRRMLAVAHVETIEDVEIALASGIDGLAHVWRRGGADLDLASRLAAKGVFVIPALAVPDGFLADGRSSLLVDPRLAAFLSARVKQHLGRSFNPVTDGSLEGQFRATTSLHARGVRLLAGTDAAMASPTVPYALPTAHGVSLHRELELLTTAGLSPIEALRAATMNPATAFGLLDRGRIVVGGKADLVLVRGDPTFDVTATRDILRVWRSGVEFERRPALAVIPPAGAQVPFPALPDLRFAQIGAPEKYLGDRWSYMEAGAADATAVVLLHGVGGNSMDWRFQFAGLSDRFHVVAWNAPGYLLSDGLKADEPGCHDYADALADFLDALKLQRVNIVGNSFGSRVAQCVAIHYPGRVIRLAMTGTGIGPQGLSSEAKARTIAVRQAQIASGGYGFGARADALLGSHPSPALLELVRNGARATNPRGFMQGVKLGLADGYSPAEFAAKVSVPVLMISGSEDRVNPIDTNAAVLQKAMPTAHLEIIDGIGHLPQVEAPDRVNLLLREFLGETQK